MATVYNITTVYNSLEITDRNRVKTIIDRLNKIYKKDELTQKYNDLETSEMYRQQPNLTITDFLK